MRVTVLFLSLLLFCSRVFSQDTSALNFQGFKSTKLPFRQNIIKSNIIPILVGQIPLCGELRFTYERMLVHNQSLSLGVSYNFPSLLLIIMPSITNPQNTTLKDFSLRGGRLTLSYRFYPLKNIQAPKGLFVGPYFSYNFVKIKPRNGNGSYEILNYTNASLIVGYQIHLAKNVFLEFFGGMGYRKNFSVYYDAYYNTTTRSDIVLIKGNPFKNVKIAGQVNLGYAF